MKINRNVGILFHSKPKTNWKIVEYHSNQQLDVWQCKFMGTWVGSCAYAFITSVPTYKFQYSAVQHEDKCTDFI